MCTINCFPQMTLNLKQCFSCRRKNDDPAARPAPPKDEDVVVMYGSSDLCIVGRGTMAMDALLSPDEIPNDTEWSGMTLCCRQNRILSFSGKVFRECALPDAAVGKGIFETFALHFSKVITALTDIVKAEAEHAQINCVYHGRAITLMAYAVVSAGDGTVFAIHIISRPTRYDVSDIAKMIQHGDDDDVGIP